MIQNTIAFLAGLYLMLSGFFANPSIYYLSDWQALQNLQKGSTADQYISTLQLTDYSKQVMAGIDPKIQPKSEFNNSCKPAGEMAELGCYIYSGTEDNAYIMKISDPAVAKEMDVIAAHEFLHAIYARLTSKKKAEVDAMVAKQLTKTTDENLSKRLEGYAKSEPGQQNNELHSIFGTEFSNLSPELETYYAGYFKKRGEIAGWAQGVNAFINSKEEGLKAQKAQIEAQNTALTKLEGRMKTYMAQGEINLYNSLVPEQNRQVRAVNAEIADFNKKIAAYNDLIAAISNKKYSSFDTVK